MYPAITQVIANVGEAWKPGLRAVLLQAWAGAAAMAAPKTRDGIDNPQVTLHMLKQKFR